MPGKRSNKGNKGSHAKSDPSDLTTPLNPFYGSNVGLVGHANDVVAKVDAIGLAVAELQNDSGGGNLNAPTAIVFCGLGGQLIRIHAYYSGQIEFV